MRFRSLALSAMFLLVACGSAASAKKDPPITTDTPASPGDPGMSPVTPGPSEKASDAGSDSSVAMTVDSGPAAPTNQAECITACEAQYPKAAAENASLDKSCFVGGTCEPVCDRLVGTGMDFGVSTNPDASAPVACVIGEGIDPIKTPSQACSDCIANTPVCCNLWISIFGSVDGRALNACANTCFTKFPK